MFPTYRILVICLTICLSSGKTLLKTSLIEPVQEILTAGVAPEKGIFNLFFEM